MMRMLKATSLEVCSSIIRLASQQNSAASTDKHLGLETLDLHGNVLIALPLGLRRLELLTTLNLVREAFRFPTMQLLTILVEQQAW